MRKLLTMLLLGLIAMFMANASYAEEGKANVQSHLVKNMTPLIEVEMFMCSPEKEKPILCNDFSCAEIMAGSYRANTQQQKVNKWFLAYGLRNICGIGRVTIHQANHQVTTKKYVLPYGLRNRI